MAWRQIPRHERAFLVLGLPVILLAMCLAGPRRTLSTYLEREDLPSRTEILMADAYRSEDLILTQRDQLLANRIRSLVSEPAKAPGVVGIVWGARHMPAVTRILLGELHYRVRAAEWVTAFTYE
jgi:hypothetical protein